VAELDQTRSSSADSRGIGRVAVLIPAWNEQNTVADVVRAALEARLGEVWVVSDGSVDATAERARAAGASVIAYPDNRGKGGAVAAGVREIEAETLILLDADLKNLSASHLHQLLEPLRTDEADTTVGLFSHGRGATDFGNRATPFLSGQRAISRATLARVQKLEGRQYAIELAITDQINTEKLRLKYVNLDGVSQVMKEEKIGLLAGFARRVRMYWQILSYAVSRRAS
jgi:glycosyltransferase involved in cell wall biosynthesis